jgi:hypothetical protein
LAPEVLRDELEDRLRLVRRRRLRIRDGRLRILFVDALGLDPLVPRRAADEAREDGGQEGEGRKVLVFSQEREVVDELASALSDAIGEGTALAFHHGLEDAQLSDVAVRFQQPASGCRVLVSDELGGEGRNFQIASAVVHLDQPLRHPLEAPSTIGELFSVMTRKKRR